MHRNALLGVVSSCLLAACSSGDGAPPIVSLTISPPSPSVAAGGAAVTLTATLTNASDTITWALVGAGSLSAPTGTSVAYTPPASAAAATTATVRASAAGVTAEAVISIAPNGPEPASIRIDGPGAVQAGGAAVTYTSTLTGGTGTIAWSLSGPGTLSTTSGPTTSYTPPAAVTAATTATLTASAAGASGSATVTVNPAPQPVTITVSGKAVFPSQLPARGMTVLIPGKPAATTTDVGTFSIPDVTPPYDCTVVWPAGRMSTTYLGLTRPDPTLQFFDLSHPAGGTITGIVTPFSATAMLPRIVFGSPDGATAVTDGSAADYPAPDRYEYSVQAAWSGPATTTGTLHALQWNEVDGLPTTYTGYASQANVAVPDLGSVAAATLVLAPVGTSTLTGSITPFQGAVLARKELEVHFTSGGWLPIVVDQTAGFTFSYATPSLASSVATIDVTVAASRGATDDVSFVYGRGLSPGATAQLTLMDPPLASAPADGATGVTLTTDFSWSAPGGGWAGVHVLATSGPANMPWYYVVTSGTTARIPDLSAYAMSLPSGAEYWWQVRSYAPFASVDAFAGPGEPLARSQQQGLSAFRKLRTR